MLEGRGHNIQCETINNKVSFDIIYKNKKKVSFLEGGGAKIIILSI